MFKKLGVIIALMTSTLLLTGCDFSSIWANITGVWENAEQSFENVQKEIEDVTKTITDTKKEIEDKIEKGKKVIDAINEFTESSEATETSSQQ